MILLVNDGTLSDTITVLVLLLILLVSDGTHSLILLNDGTHKLVILLVTDGAHSDTVGE